MSGSIDPAPGRAPLAAVAIAFGSGISAVWGLQAIGVPAGGIAALSGGCAFLSGLAAWRWRRSPAAANLFLLVLVGAVGAGRAAADSRPAPDSVAGWIDASPRPVVCEGVLTGDTEWVWPSSGGPPHLQGWFDIERIHQPEGWRGVSGRVWIHLPGIGSRPEFGDRLLLRGLIRGPSGPRPVKVPQRRFDEVRWLWLKGACGRLTLFDPEGVSILEKGRGPWVLYQRWVARLRARLEQAGRALLGPVELAYLEGLLLGEQGRIPPEIREAFRKTGTIHVLVVSGLNVGLIASVGFIALSLLRVPRGLRHLLLIGLLLVYCALTGAAPPILRATVTGALLCLGAAAGRETSALNGLGLAAAVILAVAPRTLADVSFQLSFAAVLGILLIQPRLLRPLMTVPARRGDREEWKRSRRHGWRGVGRGWLAEGLAVSAGAWIAVAPVIAWHFHVVTPVALVANLVVVPWASFLMVSGLALYGAALLHPLLAVPPAACFAALARGLSWVVEQAAALPGGFWSW